MNDVGNIEILLTNSDKNVQPISCTLCGDAFKRFANLAHHVSVKHGIPIRKSHFRCPITPEKCRTIFNDFRQLKQHYWKVHRAKTRKCRHCSAFQCSLARDLKYHEKHCKKIKKNLPKGVRSGKEENHYSNQPSCSFSSTPPNAAAGSTKGIHTAEESAAGEIPDKSAAGEIPDKFAAGGVPDNSKAGGIPDKSAAVEIYDKCSSRETADKSEGSPKKTLIAPKRVMMIKPVILNPTMIGLVKTCFIVPPPPPPPTSVTVIINQLVCNDNKESRPSTTTAAAAVVRQLPQQTTTSNGGNLRPIAPKPTHRSMAMQTIATEATSITTTTTTKDSVDEQVTMKEAEVQTDEVESLHHHFDAAMECLDFAAQVSFNTSATDIGGQGRDYGHHPNSHQQHPSQQYSSQHSSADIFCQTNVPSVVDACVSADYSLATTDCSVEDFRQAILLSTIETQTDHHNRSEASPSSAIDTVDHCTGPSHSTTNKDFEAIAHMLGLNTAETQTTTGGLYSNAADTETQTPMGMLDDYLTSTSPNPTQYHHLLTHSETQT